MNSRLHSCRGVPEASSRRLSLPRSCRGIPVLFNLQIPLHLRPLLRGLANTLPLVYFQSLTNCPRFATLFEPLSFQRITNCPICNFFVLITIQQCRGVGGGSAPNLQNLQTIKVNVQTSFDLCPFLFKRLRTLWHLRKTQLVSFQAFAHSLPKTPGWGGIPFFFEALWRRGRHAATSYLICHQSRVANHQSPPSVPLRRAARGATMAPVEAVIVLGPLPGPNHGKQVRPLRCLREERTAGPASARRRSRLKVPAWPGSKIPTWSESQVVPGSIVLTMDRRAGWHERHPIWMPISHPVRMAKNDSGRKGRQCPIGLVP